MSNSFEDTMENSHSFRVYSLAMEMLGKATKELSARQADPQAISLITAGIEMLSKQLRDYADRKDLDEAAEQELERLCKLFDVTRAES